jgi:hypothetical protein
VEICSERGCCLKEEGRREEVGEEEENGKFIILKFTAMMSDRA